MATPIKERGIRWTENYGDKSSVLKKEMDEQIGIGSYFRWEGYDKTTDTDYYVVVCPGYSKKKGYFFFAGLRKIPAEHGASGKKFTSQADALNYAMDTWNVPRPQQRPAKAYNIADIRNKSVVLDAQHNSSEAFIENQRIIVSKMQKEAFSLLESASAGGNFVQDYGEKTYPEMLCWAYRASSIMGLLAAFNTRKSWVGTDVTNVGKNSKVVNDFTGKVEKAPLAPILATCDSPSEELFKQRTAKGKEDNRLYKIKRREKDGEIESYEPFTPMLDGDTNGYTLHRWKNVRVYPKINIPSNALPVLMNSLVGLRAEGLKYKNDVKEYKNLKLWDLNSYRETIPGFTAQDEVLNKPVGKKSNLIFTFSMDARMFAPFQRAMNSVLSQATEGRKSTSKIGITNQHQKNLVDLYAKHERDQDRAEQDSQKRGKPYTRQEFGWDTPCYEQIDIGGSQLIVYDPDFGLPIELRMGSDESGNKVTETSEDIKESKVAEVKRGADKKEATFAFKSIPEIMSRNANPFLILLGKKSAEAEAGNKKSAQELKEILSMMSSNDPENSGPEFMGFIRSKTRENMNDPDIQKWATKTELNGRTGTDYTVKIKEAMERFLSLKQSLLVKGIELEAEEKNITGPSEKEIEYEKENKEFMELYQNLKPIIDGFRITSAYKYTHLDPADFPDSRTCANVLSNVTSSGYNVDNDGLPLDEYDRIADGRNERGRGLKKENKSYAPKAVARAKKEGKSADGKDIFATRTFNPSEVWMDDKGKRRLGRYHYGPMPEGVDPTQDVTGLPVVVEDPIQYIPDGKGGLRKLVKGISKLKDANSHNRFIAGATNRVNIGPPEESAKKTQRKLLKGGVPNTTFSAYQAEQCIKETVKNGRLHHVRKPGIPEQVINQDPANTREDNKEFYTFKDPDTQEERDISGSFEKDANGTVHSKDTNDLLPVIARLLNLKGSEVGPFTPLTSRDIRLIYEISNDAIDYYDSINAFRNKNENDPKIYSMGEEYEKRGVDEKKFNYGRICSECVFKSKDQIKPEILQEIESAMSDPETALKPKPVNAFSVEYRVKGTEKWETFNDEDGNSELFGSEQAAKTALSLSRFAKQNDKEFRIFSENTPSVLEHDTGNGRITQGQEILTNKIAMYQQGKSRAEVEPPRVDRFANDYAPLETIVKTRTEKAQDVIDQLKDRGLTPEQIKEEADKQISIVPEEQKPALEEVKNLINKELEPETTPGVPEHPPEIVPEQPAPVTEPAKPQEVIPEQVTQPQQPVALPATPMGRVRQPRQVPLPVPPQEEALKIFEQDRTLKRLPADMLQIRLNRYSPEVRQELERLINQNKAPVPVLVNASTVDKLVALASRYEDEGRFNEADVIDRMIKAIIEKTK